MKKKFALRIDLEVAHDARGFLLTSPCMAGALKKEPSDAEWRALVEEGRLLPIAMASKQGGTNIRLLVNTALSAAEDEEWCSHFAWRLRLVDGVVALVGGGHAFLREGADEDDDFEGVATAEAPPGDYRADIYTCFAGVNGPGLYEEDRNQRIIPQPIGKWFRDTRPGEALPAWLLLHCYEDPESDPGHEDEYDDEVFDYDAVDERHEALLDFIVQLTPLDAAPALPDELPKLRNGFFPVLADTRRVEKCPRGLQSSAT